jgi:hypothetical protein
MLNATAVAFHSSTMEEKKFLLFSIFFVLKGAQEWFVLHVEG